MVKRVSVLMCLLVFVAAIGTGGSNSQKVRPLLIDEIVTKQNAPPPPPAALAKNPAPIVTGSITWQTVTTMTNAYGPLSNSISPVSYDPATNAFVIVNRGDASSYANSSGELWFSLSTNAGSTWTPNVSSLNGGTMLARYPSGAIANETNSANMADALVSYSAPLLVAGTFGGIVYGASILDPGSAGPAEIEEAGDSTYFSNTLIWTAPGEVGNHIYWATLHDDPTDQFRLWRTNSGYTPVLSSLPPQWGVSPPADVRAWLYDATYANGKSYVGGLNSFSTDPGDVLNIGYSVSTNQGATWGTWVYPGSGDNSDWRSIPGIAGSIYDDFYDYSGNFINTKNIKMLVDANGRVHFFAVLIDTETGALAVVEMYETVSGWSAKIIQSDMKESTSYAYGAVNQTGSQLTASISPDGNVMACLWLDADVQGNDRTEIWGAYRRVLGNWSTPANLTETPTDAELGFHVAGTMKDNGGGNYSVLMMKMYETGVTSYPPSDLNNTTIYGGSWNFTSVQLAKDIEMTSASLTPNPAFGSPITVSAFIQNLGSEADPASVTLTYKVGSAPANVGDGVSESFSPTWADHGASVSFATTHTPPTGGPVTIYVRAFYPGDLDGSNDQISSQTVVQTINDIAGVSFDDPLSTGSVKENTAFTPKASFSNPGSAGQVSSFDVKYEIVGSAYSNIKSIAAIASDETLQVTFDPVAGGLAAGSYTLRAISLLGGDQYTVNDTVTGVLYVKPIISALPYVETFEDPAPEAVGGAGWHAGTFNPRDIPGGDPVPSTTIDWVIGTPAKNHISGAHSGTKCYVTKTVGNYTTNTETFIQGPIFDLSSVSGDIILEFWHNMRVEPEWDGGALELSIDGGATWNRVDPTEGTGVNFTTPASFNWYQNDSVDIGYLDPPTWCDSTRNFAGHDNGWIKSHTRFTTLAGQSDVRFRWHFSADDASVDEGWAIDDVKLSVAATTVGVGISTGWNMISNPVDRAAGQDSVTQLYPTSSFPYVFGFGAGGYAQTGVMANGPGFWGKFPGSLTNNISGDVIPVGISTVAAGWNMVGSISTSIDTGLVSSTPEGIRASVWFGYAGGYFTATTIDPGKAYWVKSNAAGAFYMGAAAPAGPMAKAQSAEVSPLAAMNSLVIADAEGNTTTLYFGSTEDALFPVSMYELPPAPPVGAFDARFESGMMVETHAKQVSQATEMPVRIQSVAYPVTVTWNIANGSVYEISAVAAETRRVSGKGSITVTNSAADRVVIRLIEGAGIPAEFALLQNYPNPFNPTTNIRFALPAPSKVNVEIYNLLGQRVRTLVSDILPEGYHTIEWNGTGATGQLMGSGVYFVRFSASENSGRSFSDVRKLMLMK